jgi:hypothetical protein
VLLAMAEGMRSFLGQKWLPFISTNLYFCFFSQLCFHFNVFFTMTMTHYYPLY